MTRELPRKIIGAVAAVAATGLTLPSDIEAQTKKPGTVQVETKRMTANHEVLDRVIELVKTNEIDKRFTVLERGVPSERVCKFNREWTTVNKPHLKSLWEYIDANQANLPQETRQAFSDLMKMLVDTKSQWSKGLFILHPFKKTVAGMLPTGEEEVKEYLRNYFNRPTVATPAPKQGENECSFLFGATFNALAKDGKVTEIQTISKKFIIGTAYLLKQNLDNPGERAKAAELTQVIGKLVFQLPN